MEKVYGYVIKNEMPIVEFWTAEYDGKNISVDTNIDYGNSYLYFSKEMLGFEKNGMIKLATPIGIAEGGGYVLLPPEYDTIKPLGCTIKIHKNGKSERESFYKVSRNGKQGVVKWDNEIIIPISYDSINCVDTNPHNERLNIRYYIICQNEKYGIATAEGKVLYEPQYSKIHYNIPSPIENDCITFDFDENTYSLPNRYIVGEIDDSFDVIDNKFEIVSSAYIRAEKQNGKIILKRV